MKKALYIDTWDKGYRNFLRIDSRLKENGISTLLLHTGSFMRKTAKKNAIREINGMVIRDIKSYNTVFLRKVLQKERPDVVIILNLSFIQDRCIVNLCKLLNIKIIYLAHGKLISPEASRTEEVKQNQVIRKNPRRIFSKKNLLVLFNYCDSLISNKNIKKLFRTLTGIFKSPSKYLTFAHYNSELDADLMLVYTNNDKELLINRGFPASRIIVVGNPELSEFLKSEVVSREIFCNEVGLAQGSKYFLYLDDGLLNNTWTLEKWKNHIIEIKELLKEQGYSLIVKLHPRVDHSFVVREINDSTIVFLADYNFKNLIVHSAGVISHYSSTIIYALLFGKKVISPRWSSSLGLLRNYPDHVVSYCESVEQFKVLLSIEIKNQDEISSYLKSIGVEKEQDSVSIITNYINAQIS